MFAIVAPVFKEFTKLAYWLLVNSLETERVSVWIVLDFLDQSAHRGKLVVLLLRVFKLCNNHVLSDFKCFHTMGMGIVLAIFAENMECTVEKL